MCVTNMGLPAPKGGDCSDDWTAFEHLNRCYRMESSRDQFTWMEAQHRCTYEQSNLAVVANRDQYEAVVNSFASSREQPWIGVVQMAGDSSLRSINPKVTPWPTDFLVDNSSAKLACLYVDFKHSYYAYTADDCWSKRAFICEKNFDGSTVPYSVPPEIYDKTEIVAESSISLALSVTVLVILILLIIIAVAYFLFKKIRSRKKIKLQPETNARKASVGTSTEEKVPSRTNVTETTNTATQTDKSLERQQALCKSNNETLSELLKALKQPLVMRLPEELFVRPKVDPLPQESNDKLNALWDAAVNQSSSTDTSASS
uniref:C-type lectin domain-containing protein n=1 Tax=Trichuris muris TaxID=70415 RepID=A0A5S6QTY9_TRIMR